MYQLLPQGMKNSITRSIKTAFEMYMASIAWNPEQYNMNDFMVVWKKSFEKGSTWYDKIEDDVKNHAEFHQGLAEKVNQVVDKILEEAVTAEQKSILIERYGAEFFEGISCKMEAKYYIEK